MVFVGSAALLLLSLADTIITCVWVWVCVFGDGMVTCMCFPVFASACGYACFIILEEKKVLSMSRVCKYLKREISDILELKCNIGNDLYFTNLPVFFIFILYNMHILHKVFSHFPFESKCRNMRHMMYSFRDIMFMVN